ncbi:helix-hairpin-helix domain-containing protein [Acidaminococcus sp.]|uniref:helix-hairpin-helix domain-containing protein n=1 Tax=Acidaminococcus sp. TaxID=1872103 RepID=UPI003D7ED11C
MDPWEKKKWLVVLGIVLCCVAGGLWQSRNRTPETGTGQAEAQMAEPRQEKKALATVYISGAVQNPGLYQVEPGIRYQEALKAAGGVTEEADLARVNLAKKCRDGSQVNVPFLKKSSRRSRGKENPPGEDGKEKSAATASGEASAASDTVGRVNLNTADEAQLTALPGIGPSLARRIILYRQQKPFRRVEDLQQVSGIGSAKFRNLAGRVEV